MPEAPSTSNTDDVLLFTAAGERLALPASDIVEIIRPPVTTRVPHSPADLLGVANLRGTVLPILSLNGLLGRKTAPASQSARVIVVKGGTPVGLLVDAVIALTKSSDGKRIDLKALLDKNFRLPSRPPRNRSVATDDADVARDEVHEELVFLCFHLANQEYALPLDQIVSVAALPDVVAGLHRTDQAMIGVAEIEGSLVPLVSARVLLGFPSHEGSRDKDRIIVTRLGGASVALVVDGVNAILRARSDALDPVPPVLTRAPGEAQIKINLPVGRGTPVDFHFGAGKAFRFRNHEAGLGPGRTRGTSNVQWPNANARCRAVHHLSARRGILRSADWTRRRDRALS